MSTTVDERIVSMQFDNQHFEKNVKTSIKSIEELKQSLKLKGATEGIENLDAAQKRVDFKEIEYAAYKAGFSLRDVWLKTSSVFEYQVARRIINSVKNIAKSLTSEPITTGLKEYETQIGAIQTILANTESKGSTLDDVNSALDELNTYADKTIYNFTEMTKNIGTFTAAGVDLETSVGAIKGIANLAAVSGSTSQQASTAMYQLSQAMSSGTVRLMDWNSVVNAGMGGQVFQDALKQTARVHGVAIDDIISKQGSFRESLSEGWLTTEILTETLQNFTLSAKEGTKEWDEYIKSLKSKGYTEEQAEAILKMGNTATDAATKVKTFSQLFDTLKETAQSGWAQTWEILIGDFEEAKQFLTELSDIFGTVLGNSANARNELLSNWKALGGREDLLNSIRNIIEGIGNIIKPVSEAFREMFPKTTAEQLKSITQGLENLTARFKEFGNKHGDKLKRTFQGLLVPLRLVVDIFKALFKAISPVFKSTGGLVGGILSLTAAIGDALVWIYELINRSDILNTVFGLIGKTINFVVSVVAELASSIKKSFKVGPLKGFQSFVERLADRMASLGDSTSGAGEKIKETFKSISAAISNSPIFKLAKSIVSGIWSALTGVFNAFKSFFKNSLDWIANASFVDVIQLINDLIAGGLGLALANLATSLSDSKSLTDTLEDLVDKLGEILRPLTDYFKQLQEQIKAKIIKTIASAILMLAVALLVIAFIPEENLYRALAAISLLFTELMLVLKVFNKGLGGDVKQITQLKNTIAKIGKILLIMAIVLKIVGKMSWDEIAKGLTGILGMLTILTAVIYALNKIKVDKKMNSKTNQLLKLAAVLALVSIPLMVLSRLSWEGIARGLTGITGALGVLVGTLAVLSKIGSSKKMSKEGTNQLLKLTAVLALVSIPLIAISRLSWKAIAKGLTGITSTLAVLTTTSYALSKMSNVGESATKGTTNLIKMASALLIASIPLLLISGLSWEGIARGLTGVAGVLAIMIGAQLLLNNFGNSSGTVKGATSLVIMASAMLVAVTPLMLLSALNWEAIARGAVGMITVVTTFMGVQILLNKFGSNSVKGVAGLVVMAAAIMLIVPPLMLLSALSWEALAKAGVALLGILTVLVAAQVILSNFGGIVGAVSLLVMVAAIQMLTIALLGLSAIPTVFIVKGLITIAAAFVVLIAAAYLAAPVVHVVAALGSALLAAGAGIALAGLGLTLLGAGLLATSVGLIALVEALTIVFGSIGIIVKAIIGIISGVIVGIIDLLGDIIKALCQLIAETAPSIARAIVMVLLSVFDLLVQVIPALADALLQIVLGILNYLADYAQPLAEAIMKIIIGVIRAVANFIAPLVDVVVDLLFGFITAVIDSLADMKTSDGLAAALETTGLLTLILTELAAMSLLAPLAMAGVLGLGLVLAELSLAFAALGKLVGLKDLIEDGGELMGTIGTAIGKLIGGIAGGFAEQFSDSLPQIGESLSEFMENVQPFLDGASSINPETLEGVKTLVSIIAAISGVALLEGLTSWLTGENSVTAFVSELVPLGEGITAFSNSVTNVNKDSVAQAAEAIKILAVAVDAIPNTGGLWQKIVGENGLAQFSSELPGLGANLASFAQSVVGINPESVVAASECIKALAIAVNEMPNTGGLWQKIVGENSLSKFSADLPVLGANLANFAQSVVGIDPEKVTAAANAIKSIATAVNEMPDTGGLWQKIIGENSLSTFSYDLPILGSNLASFASATANIDPEKVTAAAGAIKALADAADAIPPTDGLWQRLAGTSGLSTFSAQLPSLGTHLAGFATNVGNIDPEKVTAAAGAVKALADAANAVPPEDGFWQKLVGTNGLAKFSTDLPALGSGIAGFAKNIGNITPENVTAGANAAKELATMAKDLPAKSNLDRISSFADKLKGFGEKLKAYFTQMAGVTTESVSGASKALEQVEKISAIDSNGIKNVTKAVEDLTDAVADMAKDIKSDLKDAGKEAIEAFIKGINDKINSAKNACKAVIEACVEKMKGLYDSFKSAGGYLVDGFAEGITKNTFKAEANAAAMAKAAKLAAEEALGIQSPSKVFYGIGDYAGQGFVNALSDYESTSYAAGSGMATSARSGLSDAIGKIKDLINGDMDMQPTIRPVLDLSDIKSGAGMIGSLFGTDASVGVLANVNSVGSMMSRYNQNGSNGDIISAIDKLRKDMGNVNNTTYNVGGITYDDGSAVSDAIKSLIQAAKVERRI